MFKTDDGKVMFGFAREKTVNTSKGPWTFLNLSFSSADLEGMRENLNERGYVNLRVNKKRRIKDEKDTTHSVELDTYKRPEKQAQPSEDFGF